MLSLHGLFIVSLFELQFAQLFLCHSKLAAQFANLLVVVPVLVQFYQGLFLLFLDFKKRFWLVLELAKNALFIFLFVFKCDNLLYVVAAFKLSAHIFNLSLVKLCFCLCLLELCLLHQNLLVLLRHLVTCNTKHLLVLALSRFLDKCFQLAS